MNARQCFAVVSNPQTIEVLELIPLVERLRDRGPLVCAELTREVGEELLDGSVLCRGRSSVNHAHYRNYSLLRGKR